MRIVGVLLLVAALLGVGFVAPSSAGVRREVVMAGRALDIQALIDSLPPWGGTIYIPAGTYDMGWTPLYTPCDRPVHLVGEVPRA